MKKMLKVSGIVIAGLLILSGCRGTAIYNVQNNPIEAKVDSDKIYSAIKVAGASKGWIITKLKPGLAMGKLVVRDHIAVIEIPYTEKNYSIRYKDSTNLSYDPATGFIHKNYNGWIQNLENAINIQLSLIQE